MLKRRLVFALLLMGLVGSTLFMGSASATADRPTDVVVYVRSQGLFYDSIVLTDLPPHGIFQLLEMGPNGLETDFGPGDKGYLGGRWAQDFDGDGVLEYFLCPLLPPGRPNP